MSCAFTGAAWAVNINLSTGLNAGGVVQTTSGANDAHWVINGAQPARVVTPSSLDWWVVWAANDANSAWVARDPNNTDNGTGTYSRSFDLTGVDLSTISLTGRWAVDDEGTLSLNGHQIGAYQPHDGWQNFATQTFFNITDPTWFNQGTNTLVATIAQSDDLFEGVRVQASLSASVPEPASVSAFMVIALMSAAPRRRRSRCVG
jgi:hypothetical protein